MFVVNTIGYDFSFKYNGNEGKGVIKIPFDRIIYRVPNDIPEFNELRVMEYAKEGSTVRTPETDGDFPKSDLAKDFENAGETDDEKSPPLKGITIKKGKGKRGRPKKSTTKTK